LSEIRNWLLENRNILSRLCFFNPPTTAAAHGFDFSLFYFLFNFGLFYFYRFKHILKRQISLIIDLLRIM